MGNRPGAGTARWERRWEAQEREPQRTGEKGRAHGPSALTFREVEADALRTQDRPCQGKPETKASRRGSTVPGMTLALVVTDMVPVHARHASPPPDLASDGHRHAHGHGHGHGTPSSPDGHMQLVGDHTPDPRDAYVSQPHKSRGSSESFLRAARNRG